MQTHVSRKTSAGFKRRPVPISTAGSGAAAEKVKRGIVRTKD